MLTNLYKLSSLGRRELRSLASAWIGLGVFSVALRCGVSLARLEPVVRGASGIGPAAPIPLTAWAVGVASRHHLLPARCLERSVTLRYLLARRGVDSVLRIGARTVGQQLEAHAWVEVEGRPVAESGTVERDYPPLENAAVREANA